MKKKLIQAAFFVILFAGLCVGQNAEQDPNAHVDPCSLQGFTVCAENSICAPTDSGNVTCACKEGYTGDGYRGDNHTGCSSGNYPCTNATADDDCHAYGICSPDDVCKCRDGFVGDGKLNCTDIDECVSPPDNTSECSVHANCQNTLGSYNCICKGSYRGDGFNCTFVCKSSAECHFNAICENENCVCESGYVGNGTYCEDYNECLDDPCHENATCTNTEGSFKCVCNNGHTGNGTHCKALPKNCHEIFLADNNAKDGDYLIDTDGEGPFNATTVHCDMRPTFGITIINNTMHSPTKFTKTDPEMNVTYTSTIEDILAITNASGYCFQYVSSTCRYWAHMMDGDYYWEDGNGIKHYSWGGAVFDGMCICGMMDFCLNKSSSCNCDGINTGKVDEGKIINKNHLPVSRVKFGLKNSVQRMDVIFGPVVCGPHSFDVPKDCQEAKDQGLITTNTPVTIDIDGIGPLPPVLVQCDVESYPHAAITIIPHNSSKPLGVSKPTQVNFTYTVEEEIVKEIIKSSAFCRQDVSYTCLNSRLMDNGKMKGYVKTTGGEPLKYWPGGMDVDGKCACGLTESCVDKSFGCNCDARNNKTSMDFGPILKKEDLPVGSILLNDFEDANSFGEIFVDSLKCSRYEFGIEANCEAYRTKGNTQNYTYFVDPDGPNNLTGIGYDPENVDYFPAECLMKISPPQAETIIHHDKEINVELFGKIVFRYRYVTFEQVKKLRYRSRICTQAISYQCISAPFSDGGVEFVNWMDMDNKTHSYFNGPGGSGCKCGSTGDCAGGVNQTCNCDINDDILRSDEGRLSNKDDLPIIEIINTAGSGTSHLDVGPLICSEVFPTCSDMFTFMYFNRLKSEEMPPKGLFTVAPGGADGVEPFEVYCDFPMTIVRIGPDFHNSTSTDLPDHHGPLTKCFDINYKGISDSQIQALVDKSAVCSQHLSYSCKNAPKTDHVYYENCLGERQKGWGGSQGQEKCKCGVTGTCEGPEAALCNCDIEDNATRTDDGAIRDKTLLPVCKICIKLDETTNSAEHRYGAYRLGDLICSGYAMGHYSSCQDRRNRRQLDSDTVYIDYDGFNKGDPEFPLFCNFLPYPPVGIAEIRAKRNLTDLPNEKGRKHIYYFVFNLTLVEKLVNKSSYCEQEIYILCNGASIPSGKDGRKMADWEVIENELHCKAGKCVCTGTAQQVFGGFIGVQSIQPVQLINFPESTGLRKLSVGPMKCFDVAKDCDGIKKMGLDKNPLNNNKYGIDPDGAAGEDIFIAYCDFHTDKHIGITEIPITEPGEVLKITITGKQNPNNTEYPIKYQDASPKQINTLTNNSFFCYQNVEYECYNAQLINNDSPAFAFYDLFNGSASSSYGTGYETDTTGCSCHLTGTCPDGYSCRCDAKGSMATMDSGMVTDQSALPITSMNFPGDFSPDASVTATISNIRCGPAPFDLPKDCEEAFKQGKPTGETMIWPSENIKAFFVYCDMDNIIPGHGVTIIGNNKEDGEEISNEGETVEVTYNGGDNEQVKALTEISLFCQQPIKYDCTNTRFLGFDKFYWESGEDAKYYFGAGPPGKCTCGKDRLCGGDEPKSVLLNRGCNCDSEENQQRRDAGLLTTKNDLPVTGMIFAEDATVNRTAIITVGKLYCASEPFDLDECRLDFDDCHENATCHNTDGGFKCICNPGYRGLKVDNVWPNGRNCYDDDECKLGLCPYSADCTNTRGSFYCTCKEGYTQVGDRACKDINECKLNIDNCDEHAKCINLDGSYECRCKRGYEGDGVNCTSIGKCSCFGDPHCISFDQKWLHFQGNCQYEMARDGCGPGDVPTFKVLTTHWKRDKPNLRNVNLAWVKSVAIHLYPYDTTIELLQDYEVRINNIKRTMPYSEESNVTVRRFGNWIEVYTGIGLRINWDGYKVVEVIVPKAFQNHTCGLCGDYNLIEEDDWRIGPGCPNSGEITSNYNEFGNSYVSQEYAATHLECKVDCNQPPDPNECTGNDQREAEYYCNKIFDNPEGHFKACFDTMSASDYDEYYKSCLFDVCHAPGDKMEPVCENADQLVKDCQTNFQVTVTDWRSDKLCSPDCGPNKEYLDCADSDRMITCESLLNKENISVATSDNCEAGCYCKIGMVADGDGCVDESNCGCYYNKTYYSAGEVLTQTGCEERWTCSNDDSFVKENLTCHSNAVCGVKDGIYGCHCDTNYAGNGTHCKFDPCAGNPCGGQHQTCKALDDGYECICAMGFSGDCGDCPDIDECATHTDDCPKHSTCINTEGSFLCECWEGFTRTNLGCADKNECEMNLADCKGGTKCVNKMGGYDCETCKESDKCCFCHGRMCEWYGEFCGSDGRTYKNYGDLIVHQCEEEIDHPILIGYKGACQTDSCEGVECSKYKKCNNATDPVTCECVECTPPPNITVTQAVCTNKLEVYTTYCDFINAMCVLNRDDIILDSMQPCEDAGNGPPPFTDWTQWTDCSEPCGEGNQTRTREPEVTLNDFQRQKYPTEQTKMCYGDPCPNSACEHANCTGTGEVCVVVMVTPECICPNCTGAEEDPVCAKIGDKTQTFKNPCEVQAAACNENEPYEVVNVGECGVSPVNCTKMPNEITITNNEGCYSDKIDTGKCEGTCGTSPDRCCKPKTQFTHRVALVCGNNTNATKQVEFITECECIEEPTLPDA